MYQDNSTTAHAIHRTKTILTSITSQLTINLLETLTSAMMFVSALQANTIVHECIDGKPVNMKRVLTIVFITLLIIIVTWIKDSKNVTTNDNVYRPAPHFQPQTKPKLKSASTSYI